jgi:hypothetical protein
MKGRKIFWLVVGLGLRMLVAFHLGYGPYQPLNRDEYHDNGFCVLFRTLKCIGDLEAVPIVRSFLNDNDRWIGHDAQDAVQYLEQGWRVFRAVDY